MNKPVVYYDGICNLCDRSKSFLEKIDKNNRLRFKPQKDPLESIVLKDSEGSHTKSDALIRIGQHVGGIYKTTVIAKIIPKKIRDLAYDYVARNRYKWFGTCEITQQ